MNILNFAAWLKTQNLTGTATTWADTHLPTLISDLGLVGDVEKVVGMLQDLGVSIDTIASVKDYWNKYVAYASQG